jgi:hypothetical protein
MKIIIHPRVAIIPKLFPKQFGGIQGIACDPAPITAP